MHYRLTKYAVALVLMGTGLAAGHNTTSAVSMDFGPWRQLAVQDEGRCQPLEAQARRWHRAWNVPARDPETQTVVNPTEMLVATLLEWQGWDRLAERREPANQPWRSLYFQVHQADKWDQYPLLRIESIALRTALGLPREQGAISPQDLSQATIALTAFRETKPFVHWAGEADKKPPSQLTELERDALQLARSLWDYQAHRMGRRLFLLPKPDGDAEWMSFAELLRSDFTPADDPRGELRRAREVLLAARAAYLSQEHEDFYQRSTELQELLRGIGARDDRYPQAWLLRLETAYGRWQPFRLAWFSVLACLVCLYLACLYGERHRRGKLWVLTAQSTYALALTLLVIGFAARMAVSGRAPVTDLFESVVFLALGSLLLGAVFQRMYRERTALACGAAIAAGALSAVHAVPALRDAGIGLLAPLLSSQGWLAAHALTIGCAFAALAMAMALGNVRLLNELLGRTEDGRFERLAALNHRALQIGVLLLAVGMAIGAAWADRVLGRFWGWDPKEVWALVTLLTYLVLLHALHARRLGGFGLAVSSALGFCLVVMTWYGVHALLGSGFHDFGFSRGGEAAIVVAVLLQLLLVSAAGIRRACDQDDCVDDVRGPRVCLPYIPRRVGV